MLVLKSALTSDQPLQQQCHCRIVTRFNDTFLKAPSAKHLMPPFFRKYPDDMMHLKVVEFVPP